MKKITLITAFLFACFTLHTCYAFGQSFSMVAAYVPKSPKGFVALNASVSVPVQSFVIEYNQVITLSPKIDAPKFFQVRGGYMFELDRECTVVPFVGYSLSSIPNNENKRVSHGMTVGGYLEQEVNKEVSVKYEISLNNRFQPVVGIGMLVHF